MLGEEVERYLTLQAKAHSARQDCFKCSTRLRTLEEFIEHGQYNLFRLWCQEWMFRKNDAYTVVLLYTGEGDGSEYEPFQQHSFMTMYYALLDSESTDSLPHFAQPIRVGGRSKGSAPVSDVSLPRMVDIIQHGGLEGE